MCTVSLRRFRVLTAVDLVMAPGAADDELPHVDGKAILAHIKWLADDDREGRAAGSPGAGSSVFITIAYHSLPQTMRKMIAKPMGQNGLSVAPQ